jgi:hypothetical protein
MTIIRGGRVVFEGGWWYVKILSGLTTVINGG